jgi:hypothetical protein
MTRRRRDVWDRIYELFDRYDGSIKLEGASLCAWGGELRLTITNPKNAPARSIAFYSVGGLDPVDVAERLLADATDWLDAGNTPLTTDDVYADYPGLKVGGVAGADGGR